MVQPGTTRSPVFLFGFESILVLGLLACSGSDHQPLPNRRGREMAVIGHAGSGFITPLLPFNPLPSNSWAGIAKALDAGADGVEVDVQLSADSVPILYHDRSLPSFTRRPGCVSSWPADSLTRTPYHAGWPYDYFQHEHLLRLDTLLARLGRRGAFPRLHFDMHEEDECRPKYSARYSARLLRALRRTLLAQAVPLPQLRLTSMRLATLQQARQLLPALPRALEVTDADTLRLVMSRLTATPGAYQALVLNADLGTPPNVQRIHAAGFDVVLFGGRSVSTIRQELAAAPDAIETDNVPVLRKLLERK